MDVTQSEYIDVYESVDSESVLIRFKREPDGNVFVNIHDLKAAFKDATGLREEVVRNGKTRWAIYGPSSTGIIYIGSTTSRYMPQRNGGSELVLDASAPKQLKHEGGPSVDVSFLKGALYDFEGNKYDVIGKITKEQLEDMTSCSFDRIEVMSKNNKWSLFSGNKIDGVQYYVFASDTYRLARGLVGWTVYTVKAMRGTFRSIHEVFTWYLSIVSGLVTLIAFNGTLFPFIKDIVKHFTQPKFTSPNSSFSNLEQHLIYIPPLIFQ